MSKFSAKEFVDNLLTKGAIVKCDDTSEFFQNDGLPPYYDEKLYKRGQICFYDNIFAMFFAKLLGIICSLRAISILDILSSDNLSTYRRNAAATFHLLIWYESDLKHESKLWKSLKEVKYKHNAASNKASVENNYRINQRDMAFLQFGLMGYIVVRSKLVGLNHINKEDMKGFLHIWRIVGYVLGMEDEFNICRDSVEETKAICDELMERTIIPMIEKRDEQYQQIFSYMTQGLWPFNPIVEVNSFKFYLESTLNSDQHLTYNMEEYNKLSLMAKIRFYLIIRLVWLVRFAVVRKILKYIQLHLNWAAQNFPYLAAYKFGRANAFVKIMGKSH